MDLQYIYDVNMSAINVTPSVISAGRQGELSDGLKWIPVSMNATAGTNETTINGVSSYKYGSPPSSENGGMGGDGDEGGDPTKVLKWQISMLSDLEDKLTDSYYFYLQLVASLEGGLLDDSDRLLLGNVLDDIKYLKM